MNTITDMRKVLVVEDEEAILKNIRLNLELEGYEVTTAKDGKEAIKALENESFDTIVLDIMLPQIDGLTVAESLRVKQNNTPILFLSARNTTEDKIEGLKKGGDDYMTKPFDLEELLLRVKVLTEKGVLLKAKHKDVPSKYTFAGYEIDFNAQLFTTPDGDTQKLSKTESKFLKLLFENENQVVSREHILQIVWGYNVFPNTRTVDNFILNFRKYFELDSRSPKHFHSIRGVGYKFTP